MSRLLTLGFLVAATLPQDEEKKGPKNKDVQKAYAAIMKELGKDSDGLKKDLEEKKGDAAAKARLTRIQKNLEAASKLDYLKGPEEDVQKFKAIFSVFLDARMKTYLESEWNAETSEKLYERLQANCSNCHELFRGP